MDYNPGSFTGAVGELRIFGLAVMVGAVLGAVFDILRILRITFPHRTWMVFAEDLVFTLLSGMVYFCFSVEMLEGELRLYVLIAMLAGIASYLFTLGRLITGIFHIIIDILRKIMNFFVGKFRIAFSEKKFREKIKKSS